MATALGTGSISIGQIRDHCRQGATYTDPVGLSSSIVNGIKLWEQTYVISGFVNNWDQGGGFLTVNVSTSGGAWRSKVDNGVEGRVEYFFFNGFFNAAEYGYATIPDNGTTASALAYPSCGGARCSIVDSGYCDATDPVSSGQSGPQLNMDWYRGKLRFNSYTPSF